MFEPVQLRNLKAGTGTVVVLPDLQYYTGREGQYFIILLEMMEWIVAERDNFGIELVVQVGDLTNRDQPDEWRRAREAFCRLDGVLPYVLTVGNHDLGDGVIGANRETRFNEYFSLHQNPLNERALIGAWHEGKQENTASRVCLAGVDWLILALEFGPRDGAVAWADEILARHSEVPTLLVTHEFIDQLSELETGEAQRSQPETYNSPYVYGLAGDVGGVNCGEELWDSLVARHPQIRAVLNGHYRPFARDAGGRIVEVPGLAAAQRRDIRADGSMVEQFMFNAQWEERGGDGWMLLLRGTLQSPMQVERFSPRIYCVGR